MRVLQARVGRSLMQEAVNAGVEAIAVGCGGSLTCATCHAIVDADGLCDCPCFLPMNGR